MTGITHLLWPHFLNMNYFSLPHGPKKTEKNPIYLVLNRI